MALINPNTTAAPPIKPAINLGAGLDILTGSYVTGTRGESILNGGLGFVTGTVGIGNSFKSAFCRWMMMRAMGRMTKESAAETYDTEINVMENQLANHYNRIPELEGEDVIFSGRWKIVDGRVMHGNVWYKAHKDFLQTKGKDKKNWIETPFFDRDRKTAMKMIIPTFTFIDSFSEFKTEDVEEMNDKNQLGDSGANTMHMRQGLSKLRLLMDAPALSGGTYDYTLMTAHIGKEMTMQNAGPGGQVPIVKLKHLKNGDKIKGTTDKFTFITHSCWHCYDTKPMINQSSKTVLYPRDRDDDVEFDTDLNEVKIRNLRCKSGPSGMAMTLIVSQSEGVLPSLTEYHYVKTNENEFGFEGNNTTFALSLLPDVKLMRTTVRGLLDSNEKLQRAMNITSEMLQIKQLWHHAKPYICTPKELRDDLTAMGYDWEVLFNTRGWWTTIENEHRFAPFLSTWDLLAMRVGEYIPFWFTAEQKKAIDLSKAKRINIEVDQATRNAVAKLISDAKSKAAELLPEFV